MDPTETKARKPKEFHTPTYRRIEAELRQLIQRGTWLAGTMLPGRRELAKQFGVDLNTIQNAIRLLLDDGTLRAESGRGTFVAKQPSSGAPYEGDQASLVLSDSGRPALSERSPLTVGIISALWTNSDHVRVLHDNWPVAVLRAFEAGMTELPNATVKFRDATRKGKGFDVDEGYYECLSELVAEGVNALAVIFPSAALMRHIEALVEETSLPVVVVCNDPAPCRAVSYVCCDEEYGGYLATQHLLQRGYTNISVFWPYADTFYSIARKAGIQKALDRAGIRLIPATPLTAATTEVTARIDQRDVARKAARTYFRNRGESWGIIAINDHAGNGLLDVAPALGLVPGRDFGLIAFDDLSDSRIMDMSSLHPPLDSMGLEAAHMLQKRLRGLPTATEIRLRANLVARSSSQPMPSLNTVRIKLADYSTAYRSLALK